VYRYNKSDEAGIKYKNLPSAIRSLPHGPDVPVPTPPTHLENVDSPSSPLFTSADEMIFTPDKEDSSPHLFTEAS
jgi:hypothetical protein